MTRQNTALNKQAQAVLTHISKDSALGFEMISLVITRAFAQWLKGYKDQTGCSNADLADFFETSESSIQHILSGYRRVSEKLMDKVFNKLNLQPLKALQPYLSD